ncbi:MAG: Hsp33 family molecular chaperone HslO [Gammaproteobacteria bacterium]|nr:Hsp33 family molecular chaperone HslO [Gammaproteobacteria bacterium]
MTADPTQTDLLHRFSFAHAPIRGQWVRLETVLEQICANQPYPPAVSRLLGQMLSAVAMFADGIKFNGAVTLHSQGQGPLTTLMAECRSQNLLRGIARWNPDTPMAETAPMSELIGDGQLAISLLPDSLQHGNREDEQPVSYQGLIGIEQGDFAHNLEAYFATSEQIPSRLFFASHASSVTGLLLQRIPAPDNATELELDSHAALWEEVGVLAATLTDAELLELQPDALLRRLFNTHTLNLHPARELRFECTCNRQKTAATLQMLGRSELLELLQSEGEITVTCEVCGQPFLYQAVDIHLLLEPGNPRIH